MINKRQLYSFTCMAMMVAAAFDVRAASESANWTFDVLLDDKPIGYHRFNVVGVGPDTVLETEAKFDVKFLFVTAFRYRHENIEVWSDGCLSRIDAVTDNNGEVLEVRGEQGSAAFDVSGQRGDMSLGECVQTFAYWNPAILNAERLLNSQTGAYEDVSVTYEGVEDVRVGSSTIGAKRYRLTAEAGDIELWYSDDESQRWLALEAPAKGGRTIRYEPVSVPAFDRFDTTIAGAK